MLLWVAGAGTGTAGAKTRLPASGLDASSLQLMSTRTTNIKHRAADTMADSPLLWSDFARAIKEEDGYLLGSTICPEPPARDPARLYDFKRSINDHSIQTDLQYKLRYNPDLDLEKTEAITWIEIFKAYYAFVCKLLQAEEEDNRGNHREAEWTAVYEAWREVLNQIYRAYNNSVLEAWTIPCLYVVGKYLRVFAIKADEHASSHRDSGLAFGGLQEEDAFNPSAKNEKLEDAARQINRLFSLCLSDRYVSSPSSLSPEHPAEVSTLFSSRSPIEESRKWALYYIANLLFKTYFRLNSISLSKNILRSLHATSVEMPPLSAFPRSHQVTFNYYSGVMAFLQEDYANAEDLFTKAYSMCSVKATENRDLILTYLIPTKLLTSHQLPTQALLKQSPALERLFTPITHAVRTSDIRAFNTALEHSEDDFVKRRIYLTLERGRDVIIRNILRKVFIAGGFEAAKEGEPAVRRTRVPISEFAAGLMVAGADVGDGEGGVDVDEVECLIANSIYKVS